MTLSHTNMEPTVAAGTPRHSIKNWFVLLALVYLMLLAVSMIGSGFKFATADHARGLFEFASNPVMGLIIGMVSTALIQSSSTVTSIIVAMVAGGLPVPIAVPMIMGANIGTSITNTIVSLGHVARKDEFRRAFHAVYFHHHPALLLKGVHPYLANPDNWLKDDGSEWISPDFLRDVYRSPHITS